MAEVFIGMKLRIKPSYAESMRVDKDTTATVIHSTEQDVTIKVDGYAASDSYTHEQLFENWTRFRVST